MADPAGEADRGALRLDFDRRVMLRFHGTVITSDGGLLAYRELDDVLALTTSVGERLRPHSPPRGRARPGASAGGPSCSAACSCNGRSGQGRTRLHRPSLQTAAASVTDHLADTPLFDIFVHRGIRAQMGPIKTKTRCGGPRCQSPNLSPDSPDDTVFCGAMVLIIV